MEDLIIEETHETPRVGFYYQQGNLEITGRSLIENVWDFYLPLIQWLDEYVKKPYTITTKIVLKLDYFNTSSSKAILDILQTLRGLTEQGHEVHCHWYQDQGEEEEDLLRLVEGLKIEVKWNS